MKERETHEGRLTITRPTCSDGSEYVSIKVRDYDSVTVFLEIEVPLVNFAKAITGQAEIECTIKPRCLDNVGKKRISKDIEFEIIKYGDKEEAMEKLQHFNNDGWVASSYFGSQNSFYTKNDINYARTSAHKWVAK